MAESHLTACRERLLELLRELSWHRGKVVLSSGIESDFYIDCRQTALHAEGAALIGALVFAHIEALRKGGERVDGVGGMTLGADPIASAAAVVSFQQNAPAHAFLVRKEAKSHGTAAAIEGMRNLGKGARVLVVEDVVTTGGSTLRAVERIRINGLVPVGIWSLVDREEGGRAALATTSLPYTSLFSRADFT